MEWLQAIVLGLVHGITDILPVSASAHSAVVDQLLFPRHPAGAGSVATIQLGAAAAILVFFVRDVWLIAKSWTLSLVGKVPRTDANARFGWLVIFSTLLISGLFSLRQDVGWRNLWISVTLLAVTALLLSMADSRAGTVPNRHSLGWRDGLFIAFSQAFVVLPGAPRFGLPMATGMMVGLHRRDVFKYSLLLGLPAFGASKVMRIATGAPMDLGFGPTLLAAVVALLAGFGTIWLTLRFVQQHSFAIIVWYGLAVAATVMALLFNGVLTP